MSTFLIPGKNSEREVIILLDISLSSGRCKSSITLNASWYLLLFSSSDNSADNKSPIALTA